LVATSLPQKFRPTALALILAYLPYRAAPLSVDAYCSAPGRPLKPTTVWTKLVYASIMVSRRNQTLLSLSIFLGVLAWNVAAAAVKGETGAPVGQLSVHEIEEQLQVCL